MNRSIIPVILCGGLGTRLWPLSRESNPKQFMRVLGNESLLQQTILWLGKLANVEAPLLVCNEDSRFMVAEQVREVGADIATILLEPMRRNTAPAIAVAALKALEGSKDPLLLILPSDHVIEDCAALRDAIGMATIAAGDGGLVLFGVTPTRPDTGYGYLRVATDTHPIKEVRQFVEKPDRATAESYFQSGEYFWNSGMFLFRATSFLEELERFHPEILAASRAALEQGKQDIDFLRLDSAAYAQNTDISIDHAVMEHTKRALMVAMEAGWSDVGSWKSVREVSKVDALRNAVRGDVLLQDCEDCLIHSTSRLVTAIGLRNAVVVETADAILVASADHAQETKAIVNALKESQRSEVIQHREVYRPWGSYDAIETGDRFQVKRIKVNPGAKLSLQLHHHRAEHWIVVSGTAHITNGDRKYLLCENESTYIPVGAVHSLENLGKIPLELIEIQSGSYLGEDDIVRFEDRYGRI